MNPGKKKGKKSPGKKSHQTFTDNSDDPGAKPFQIGHWDSSACLENNGVLHSSANPYYRHDSEITIASPRTCLEHHSAPYSNDSPYDRQNGQSTTRANLQQRSKQCNR